jgi:hypothetical protein
VESEGDRFSLEYSLGILLIDWMVAMPLISSLVITGEDKDREKQKYLKTIKISGSAVGPRSSPG